MKTRLFFSVLGALALLLMTGSASALATGFSYQGKLTDGGTPANGAYDFQFNLYAADSGGAALTSPVNLEDVTVTDGLFTVQLDFGDVFDGSARYLEIAVRAGSSTGAYTTLVPRQQLTATPYALYADTLDGLHASSFALTGHGHFGETWTGSTPGAGLTVSGAHYGIHATGNGIGFWGCCGTGVYGASGPGGGGVGVYGLGGAEGVHGEGTTYGVYGYGPDALYGQSTTSGSAGVHARAFGGAGNYAGLFDGNVLVNGDFTVAGGGAKSAAVDTTDYGTRALYAVESPESWFEDFGTGQLANGEAVIPIEPIFAETVNLTEDYHVFLTPLGDCALYVDAKSPTSFAVRAIAGQTCSMDFDYRIVAKRLGFENVRLAEMNMPATEPASK